MRYLTLEQNPRAVRSAHGVQRVKRDRRPRLLSAGQAALALPEAFFLLSDPALGPKTSDLYAAVREEQARLERVCGISPGLGCCTLLLYLP